MHINEKLLTCIASIYMHAGTNMCEKIACICKSECTSVKLNKGFAGRVYERKSTSVHTCKMFIGVC